MPIPRTRNNLDCYEVLSALQKCVRRGMAKEAMEFAIELSLTSKSFHTMLCKRLIVICLEDVDNLGQPAILPYVHSAMTLAKEWWDSDPARAGKSRLAIANVVLMLASARKSRLADHFQCVAVWGALLEGRVPSVPDFALDHHTAAGRRMGRTIDFFLAESTRCVPAIEPDAYRDEAARLWKLRESRSKTTPARDQGELQIDVDE